MPTAHTDPNHAQSAIPAWLDALRAALARDAGNGQPIELVQTHISWLLLTGRHVYKIKKPLNLAFLDFSTLEQRRFFCAEELRLNRRLAPQLYIDVVDITGDASHAQVGGTGPVIDYAVRMRQFPKHALASSALAAGRLTPAHFDALAARIAAFHQTAGVAAAGSPHGQPEAIHAAAIENFRQLDALLPGAADRTTLAALQTWTHTQYQACWSDFNARLTAGAVRECHGDLHLGNLVLLDDALVPFDCLEFNPALRWIDIMNEVAFLMMDLTDHGQPALAWRFVNTYLDASGAHEGLSVLRYYLAYRALVRAKVHALRAAQAAAQPAQSARLYGAAQHYLGLAQNYTQRPRPALMLMHGFSGSGKSVVAQALAQGLCAIRLRSDVERKRLAGLASATRSASGLNRGIYGTDATQATYGRLADLARLALEAGFSAVVDATFLAHAQREAFRLLAAAQGVPCLIIDVSAPQAVLRQRIDARARAAADPSEADQRVLTSQLAQAEALRTDESRATLVIDSTAGDAEAVAARAVAAVGERLCTT